MAGRSLNKVMLIGNLTRDPELRYTPTGVAVVSFGLATNRSWTTDSGEKREEAEFHRIVAWNKLAELCSQLLAKGRKVFVEGRLQTRNWQGQDGAQHTTTEIIIDDMIILDSRMAGAPAGTVTASTAVPTPAPTAAAEPASAVEESSGEPIVSDQPAAAANDDSSKKKKKKDENEETEKDDQINPDDIPF